MQYMKYPLMEQAEDGQGGGGESKAPDVSKLLVDGFKALKDDLGKLSSRIDRQEASVKPAPAPKEDDEDLSTMILVDPAKAVNKIKAQVREEVLGSVNNESSARDSFQNKFMELQNEYPEIANTRSALHTRAKEILAESNAGKYDSAALERAILRAASEKGVLAVKYRKQDDGGDDEESSEYLGSGSGSESRSGSNRKRGNNDKLPRATLDFAELTGLNVKDPKVVERLTKTHNERKGNWHKYK